MKKPSPFKRCEPQEQRIQALEPNRGRRYRIEGQLRTVANIYQDSVHIVGCQTKARHLPINTLDRHVTEAIVDGCTVLEVGGNAVILTSARAERERRSLYHWLTRYNREKSWNNNQRDRQSIDTA